MYIKIRCIVICLIFCSAGLGCVVSPPVDKMAEVQTLLNAARDANAQIYAENEYRTAEETLKRAQKEMAQRNYEEVLTLTGIAKLQANYAIALTKWKVKAKQLNETQAELRKTMDEAKKAKAALDEVKSQIQ
jgi:hypothetical protein